MTGSGAPTLTGQTLAQYEVGELIGEGELGTVYLARDTAAARAVVLEVLPGKSAVDQDRLRQEVRAAAALDHWSIARIYEFAKTGDVAFVARELVPGRTLAEVLRSGPMDAGAALECARQIAGALAAGHAIGVTHRHLSPRNIVLADNRARLINFGLTVPPAQVDRETVAPEQLDGRGADARSDIYSLGIVMRKMLGPAITKAIQPIVARATRKKSGRRYQLMEDVLAALDRAAGDPATATQDRGHRVLAMAGLVVLAIVAIGWWMLGGRDAVKRGPARVTSDSGLTTDGAISADGRTIVYASDRGSSGVLNLWTQPVSGGPPSRLTQGADEDREPAISPDATRVVFRSERNGGGVYVVPVSGGSPQLLVQGGRTPRFSPDGQWISYWTGDPLDSRGAGVWVIASSGGRPTRIHEEFRDARYPVWSPDGRSLIFVGHTEREAESRFGDWYVAPVKNGAAAGQATRTGAETLLHMQAVREFAAPEAWVAGQVIFSGRMTPIGKNVSGQPRLLRIPISPDIMQTTGAAHEVTSGEQWDAHPSVAAKGRVVFTRREVKPEIWSVAAKGSGELHRLTQGAGDVRPALSRDGTRLAYRVSQADGHTGIRVVDVASGHIIATVPNDGPRDWPVLLSATGDELVYSVGAILRKRLPNGEPERISRHGWDQVTSWSSDGKFLLLQRGRRGLDLLDVATGHDRELLRDDRFPIVEARFSPDDKWIAFTLLSRPHPQIFVVPVLGADATRIAVTDDDVSAGSPAWSADGRQIYYLTACQGSRCIWARRLDPSTRKPSGEAFAVRHFHGARFSLVSGIEGQNAGLVAAGDRLAFGMFETTGNIWTLPSLPRP